MAVMPEGRDNEEPDAGHGNERAAGAPPEDILARLLEYRRRLQEEIGGEPASLGEERDAPHAARAEEVHAEPVAESEEIRSEREAQPEPEPEPEPEPTPRAPDEANREPPDARQLRERIDRLDETLARISAMLPLLRGGADREGDHRDPKP
jgi:hypothetical protein